MKNLLLLIILIAPNWSFAQVHENNIKQTILLFFEGMQKSDTNIINNCLHKTARFQTALSNNKTNVTTLENEPVDSFLLQVLTIKKRNLQIEERITQFDIKVDYPMASVWADYEFYVNGKLSHRGVDAFQLFYENNSWKIIQVCDTRKR
ncbi:MAG: nuclear transport factor 2 family protein [Candidatus Methylacidiphilales bacterium]